MPAPKSSPPATVLIDPEVARRTPIVDLALNFHQNLQQLKQATPLLPGLKWYPWHSLGQFAQLEAFLRNSQAASSCAFLDLIGLGPVLDIGCGDGDISFFLEALGARVDAIDHAPTNYNAMYGVKALKEALASPLRIAATDLDQSPDLPDTNYTFAIMLGVLYHLKNPFLVLEALARNSRHVFLSTRVASLAPDRKLNYGHLPVAYLVEEDELNHDETNFWIFTEAGLKRILRRSGWDILHFSVSGPAASDPVTPQGDARAFVLARSRLAEPPKGFRLLAGWHALEYEAWRWTQRNFSVELALPQSGDPAMLRFSFHLPEPVFEHAASLTLEARIGDAIALPPASFTQPGQHVYQAPIPPGFKGPTRLDLSLSHAIEPRDTDGRELGLQVDFSAAPAFVISPY